MLLTHFYECCGHQSKIDYIIVKKKTTIIGIKNRNTRDLPKIIKKYTFYLFLIHITFHPNIVWNLGCSFVFIELMLPSTRSTS